MVLPEKLSSISEYGDETPVNGSLAGYSTYTGYTSYARSPSGNSLNTLSVTSSRTYKNGLPDKTPTEKSLSQRLQTKSLTHKHNYEVCKKIRVSLALFGILLLVAAIFMLSFYLPKQYQKTEPPTIPLKKVRYIWNKHVNIENLTIELSNNFTTSVLESEIGPRLALKGLLGHRLSDSAKTNFSKFVTNTSIEMEFLEQNPTQTIKFNISKANFSEKCYNVHWSAKYHTVLQDCYNIDSSKWFGLGEFFEQSWPINQITIPTKPFLTRDFILKSVSTSNPGGVLEPFIINSRGGGIYVHDHVALHISMNMDNNGLFCIQANQTDYNKPYVNENSTNVLDYTICIDENIRKVHKIMFEQFIEFPIGVPDKRMMLQPIWSTWAKYKAYRFNQENLIKFVKEIKQHNFTGSHIEMDDGYSTKYGDFDFDKTKFNDIVHAIRFIRSEGFRVTVWVYPFANIESDSFLKYKSDWVYQGERRNNPKKDKNVIGITRWWRGMAGILDVTDKGARDRFKSRLDDRFKTLKIDGFKYDGGESAYLPLKYQLNKELRNPNYYSYYYAKLAHEVGGMSEVRIGYRSQKFPLFVRLLDRTSAWEDVNGLRSVLTATLTFSILGYPFVLPDMVGGNAYQSQPKRELYIRWAQLTVFLPAVQFSICPWEYDQEVVGIVQQALNIRTSIADYIYELAIQTQHTGEPIIRPLWWYWPEDDETAVIGTEFMLGDRYLVAPVLHVNVVSHAIYLPAGIWQEQWGQGNQLNMTEGGIKTYNVTLSDICYFKLLQLDPFEIKQNLTDVNVEL